MAGKVYLANAFSLGMLRLPRGVGVSLCVQELDLERWVEAVGYHLDWGELDCAIGHASTAELAKQLLGMVPWRRVDERKPELACQRKAIQLEPGDLVYVIQLKFRPPEGKVYDYSEIVELLRQDKIGFYAVYYGTC